MLDYLVCITLLGEEQLAVHGELLFLGILRDDTVEVRGAAVAFRAEDAAELLSSPFGAGEGYSGPCSLQSRWLSTAKSGIGSGFPVAQEPRNAETCGCPSDVGAFKAGYYGSTIFYGGDEVRYGGGCCRDEETQVPELQSLYVQVDRVYGL